MTVTVACPLPELDGPVQEAVNVLVVVSEPDCAEPDQLFPPTLLISTEPTPLSIEQVAEVAKLLALTLSVDAVLYGMTGGIAESTTEATKHCEPFQAVPPVHDAVTVF